MLLNKKGLYIIFGLFFTFFVMNLSAQSFYKVYGTSGNDYAKSVVLDRDSGYVVVGATDGLGQGAMDGYFLKIDSAGDLQYTRTFGGTNIDWLTDVKVVPDGFIISGYTNSFSDDYRIYLIKTDENGIVEWQETYGDNLGWYFANSIAIADDGNYVLVGETYSQSNGLSDAYVTKINTIGDVIWEKRYGGNGKDWFNDIDINDIGEIVVCGAYTNTDSETDFWVMKLDVNGDEIWSVTLGDTLNDEASGLVFTHDDFIVVNGTDERIGGSGRDSYFVRLQSDGTLQFSDYFAGANEDYGVDVVHYPSTNNVIVTLGTSSYGFGKIDPWVTELYELMLPTLDMHYNFGTTENDLPQRIDTTYDKGVIVVGDAHKSIFGSQSIFINKIDSNVNIVYNYDEIQDLSTHEPEFLSQKNIVFPNPASGFITIDSKFLNNNYTIYNALGAVVDQGVVKESSLKINLTDGFYFLSINSHVFKVVVKK
jgi:hypothetical protein